MAYSWIQITRDFDRTLPFSKVRWAAAATWSDGYFSELPSINCDGKGWTSITGAEWGYAGMYTQNLGSKAFFVRTQGTGSYTTKRMNSTDCTSVDDGQTPLAWEYEYQVPLYWGGVSSLPNYTAFNGGTGLYVYVQATIFETDVDTLSASSSASSYTISLSADTELTWTASTEDGWLSVSPATGTGDGTLTVTTQTNYKHSPKTGTITITDNEGDVITITVNQAKVPNILQNRNMYRSGNLIDKAYRSGEIIFQRVSLNPEI